MKKSTSFRFVIACFLVAVFSLLVGCGAKPCTHQWAGADCVNPERCTLCGETQGEALGHDWVEAACESPECCTRCGETRGEALGHDWAEATCESPEHCYRCNEARGEAVAHSFGRWMLRQENMYHVCTSCGQEESAPLDYPVYLSERICGRWNMCSMVKNGKSYSTYQLPETEADLEYCFYEDGHVARLGFENEEISTGWSIDLVKYDSAAGQHLIYLRFPEQNALTGAYFTCDGDDIYLIAPLNSKGDRATLSNTFGDGIAALIAGTWTAWWEEGLYNITFSEDRSFTADFDGEISGFWQPREPEANGASTTYNAEIMLNYEKNGKACSQHLILYNFNPSRSQEREKDSMYLSGEIHDKDLSFSLDAKELLTEAVNRADTAHLGTWTSLEYTVSVPNKETYIPDEEQGLSTEYSLTFQEDGSFIANLHKEIKGTWEIRDIRQQNGKPVFVYSLKAKDIDAYSYFHLQENGYVYISGNDDVSYNYTLRQMTEAEIAERNQLAAAAPTMVVGEWFGTDANNIQGAFLEDGTFSLSYGEGEARSEFHGYWHFHTLSEYNGVYTYFYDIESVIEIPELEGVDGMPDADLSGDGGMLTDMALSEDDAAALGTDSDEAGDAKPMTYREDFALQLEVKDGLYHLQLNSFYVSGSMTNADGLAQCQEAVSAIAGHWSADTVRKFNADLTENTEVSADFYLDISEDGSFTGFAGRDLAGRLQYSGNRDGAEQYWVYYDGNAQVDAIFTFQEGTLGAFIQPYSVNFSR